jgi:hypothetical protein
MKKLPSRKLTLHRETVMRLEALTAILGAEVEPVRAPQTSPLCVSTCCGSC